MKKLLVLHLYRTTSRAKWELFVLCHICPHTLSHLKKKRKIFVHTLTKVKQQLKAAEIFWWKNLIFPVWQFLYYIQAVPKSYTVYIIFLKISTKVDGSLKTLISDVHWTFDAWCFLAAAAQKNRSQFLLIRISHISSSSTELCQNNPGRR